MKILCDVDGILTPQLKGVDLQAWFDDLFKIYKEDQEKEKAERKYTSLLDAIILFVSEDDFNKAKTIPDPLEKDEALEKLAPFARYLEMIKKYSGVDTHRLLYYLKDVDTSQLTEAIGLTEEALKHMQEAETKHQTQVSALKQSANNVPEKLEEIAKLEKKHAETWQGREEDITKKLEAVSKAGAEKQGSSLAEKGLSEIESFEQDVEWKKHLEKVAGKIAQKKD